MTELCSVENLTEEELGMLFLALDMIGWGPSKEETRQKLIYKLKLIYAEKGWEL